MATPSSVLPLPFVGIRNFRTPLGSTLRGAGRIAAYVRSSGQQDLDPPEVVENLVTTTAEAITKSRSSRGDVILYLDGHSENVTSTFLSGVVAGTKFMGLEEGSLRPQFTFNATGSTFAVNVANVTFENLIFIAGANGVTKGINVTGARFTMRNCEYQVAVSTDNHMLIAVELGTGAHYARIIGNHFDGIVGEPITDGIHIAAAVNAPYIANNLMLFASAADATACMIRTSAACLRGYIGHNVLYNSVSSGDYAIVIGDQASQGMIEYNRIQVLDSGAVPASRGFSIGASSLWGFAENRVATVVSATGIVSPAADS